MKFNIATFLLAVPSLVQAEANLRGDADNTERELAKWKKIDNNKSYNQKLGQCKGALCGVWGDPHVITCDGAHYDCQGVGLFTAMKNHMINIQAHFRDIGEEEHKKVEGWGLTHGATLSNDLVFEMYPNHTDPELRDKFPVVQLGYADMSRHDGTYLNEDGCLPYQTFDPVNMPGTKESSGTLVECRTRCNVTEGCTKFSWWADYSCHVNNDDSVPVASDPKWSRALAGTLNSTCGEPFNLPQLEDDREDRYYGLVGNRCPLLLHINGTIQDVSEFRQLDNGYLYGEEGAPLTIQLFDNHLIEIDYEIGDGDGEHLTIQMYNRGGGPGQLWGCQWHWHVCLPQKDEEEFRSYGVGLLGSPDGDRSNDWMTPDNEPVTWGWGNRKDLFRHSRAYNYCVDNWCVSQLDNKMTFSGNKTYEDYKCQKNTEWDEDIENNHDCVLEIWKIIAACKNETALDRFACEMDCCKEGCNDLSATLEEIHTLRDDESDDDVRTDDVPVHDQCDDDVFSNTGESVCGGGNVVHLLKSHGELSLPETATVFYGLEMNVEPHGTMAGKAIRFRVNNFLEEAADIYVKHTKSVLNDFMDPVCDPMRNTAGGCHTGAQEIEVACHNYEGVPAFAIVQVYVQARGIASSDTQVDKCCAGEGDERDAIAGDDAGVAVFTFEIACDCPTDNTN